MKYITINEEKSRKKEKSSESRDKLNQTVALPVIKPEEFPIPNRIIEAKRANNEYSEDFPLKVLPNNLYKKIQILTQGDPNISRKLKDKIEKWYFTYPESTMKDAFKPQPLKFLNETKLYSRKKNEFSTYVNAYFKGGVIDRPLLDPQNRFMKIQNQLGENQITKK